MKSKTKTALRIEQPGRSVGYLLKRYAPAIAGILILFGALLAGPASAAATLPPYDGAMDFPAIHGPSDPEEYSWEVTLGPGQQLASIDDQHAEVYYEDGTVSFLITAEPAHDAAGTAVPTSLAVSEGDVVTLTVHHRAGNPAAAGLPFVYPVSPGPAFKVGDGTVIVQGPLDESELREARERIERENPAAHPPAAIVASASERPVLFSTECANRHYKPTEIIIACADARTSFEAKEWIRWTSKDAFAEGTLLRPDCPTATPIVACTKNTKDKATVLLYRVRFCPKQGRRYFTRLRLSDPEASNKYIRSIKLNYPCGYVQ